ncbi:hypothetical protein CASFOL_038791 [Castilleja foliolosa]|uniref:DUF1985 domain-containing protein n=1 Tax=Castilleja foliolosa TaxID=1961234 RepID=A0ABD3BIV1_9LAMI
MFSQQVIKEGADEDELWFLVGDEFVRFSKYEYALVTGLRFGPTSFDPNEDCDIPSEGVYRKLIDPENKFSKKDAEYQGDKWETFPWGAYTFQILIMRMKNAKVKPQDNYHIYGFSHAFMHFILEAVHGLADIITSKPKHKFVQPRLFKKKPLAEYLNFFDKQQSPVPAQGQGDGSVPTMETRSPDNSAPPEEVRPQKRVRTTERPNVDFVELLTRILEWVRRENELFEQRLMRQMHEIEERA